MNNKDHLPANGQTPNWVEQVAFWKENEAAIDRAFDIALRIMDLMDAKGWKNADLARAIDKSPQYVSRLRKGKELNIGQQLMIKLEQVLGGSIMEVVSTPVTAEAQSIKTFGLSIVYAAWSFQQHFEYADSAPPLHPEEQGRKALHDELTGSIKNAPFLMPYSHA